MRHVEGKAKRGECKDVTCGVVMSGLFHGHVVMIG